MAINKTGKNMSDVKNLNRCLILNILYKSGGLSRKEIARRTGLTPAAITLITNDLKNEGIIQEIGEQRNANNVGRNEIIIDIDYAQFYALGVRITLKAGLVSCVDLSGKEVFRAVVDISSFNDAQGIIQKISTEILTLIAHYHVPREKIVGVGIGVRGVVDAQQGICINSHGLWGKNVPVQRLFEEQLNLAVIVDNNVRAMAYGYLFVKRDSRIGSVFLIVQGETGIGAGLVVDNRIYKGYSNRAIEFGHMVVDANGDLCRCGNRGCLETVASIEVIKRKARSLYSIEKTPVLVKLTEGDPSKITTNLLTTAYSQKDPAIVTLMDDSLEDFSVALMNAIKMMDPQKVVVNGGFFQNNDYYAKFVELMGRLNNDCPLERCDFGEQLNTLGPATLAINAFFKRGAHL